MARAELDRSWTTSLSLDDVEQRVRAFFASHRVVITAEEPGLLTGKQGSQLLTRLLGGWFVSPPKFPKSIKVALSVEGGAVTVRATMEEAMGFGYLDPHFKSRYEDFFAAWMEELVSETGGA